ncbi:MAG TPA: hypothetical protein DEG23_04615, partial [Coxiellaceae bacterium]|nr:hypothetical protein [Coxiellaceae bacterium]
MYGLSVLTWGSGPDVKKYSTAIKRELFSGEAGHAALWLTIPDTSENRKILEELNTKGMLKVSYKEIIVLERKEKAIEVYFSFWGDPKTSPSAEKHKMVDYTADLLGEAESKPGQYPLRGASSEQAKTIKAKLEEMEREKKRILSHVKDISRKLLKAKSEEAKQDILSSESVKKIFDEEQVEDLEGLKEKLREISAGIRETYKNLDELGVLFGKLPDSIVQIPIDVEGGL